jgi:hypothetical protein
MKQYLFSSKTIRALIVVAAVAVVPVATASANTVPTTTIFASAQSTALLGQEVPVLGTQGWYITVPVKSTVVPEIVWNAIDFTVTSEVTVGDMQVVNLWVDPHMAR